MSICLFGVCVPYSAILPVILILLKPVLEFLSKTFGLDFGGGGKKKTTAEAGVPKVEGPAEAVVLPDSPFNLSSQAQWKALLASSTNKPVIVRFTASWCGPCKKIEPFITSLAEKHKANSTFVSVDVDVHADLMEEFSVVGIPTLIAIKSGAVVDKYRGSSESDVLKLVDGCVLASPSDS